MNSTCTSLTLAAVVLASLHGGCRRENPDGAAVGGASSAAVEPAAAPTNRVEIPGSVRANLGITFAKVQRREVVDVMRVPGRFELQPGARRRYAAPLDGRVELLVGQYQRVEPGRPLFLLDSPQWRAMQREIDDTQSAIDVAKARLESLTPLMEAHQVHEQGLREAVELWSQRVALLESVQAAGGGQAAELAEARIKLTEAKAAFGEVMEKDAELQVRRAEIESGAKAAEARLELLLRSAATVLGVPVTLAVEPLEVGGPPRWRATNLLEIRAVDAGIVDALEVTEGAWARQGEPIVEVIDPSLLRFRAAALQSDLGRLRSGLPAAIVPPQGGSVAADEAISTIVELVPNADARQRTIDLLADVNHVPTWAIPGVGAFLEIRTGGSARPELAIPLASVVRDGTRPILFRRDPANPDRAIRLEADLGLDDGRWVAVHSGLREGDEVVLDGAYQLLLATSGSVPKGGHFHADGTFHADDH